MPKIINLEDAKEVWIAGECLCVDCSNKWSAVVHIERQTNLECPACGSFKGAVINVYA